MKIEPAASSDLAGIRWLLSSDDLPTEDLTEESLKLFQVVRDEKGVVGVIGIELREGNALLRSLVVAQDQRKTGLGAGLVRAAEALAATQSVSSIYLLTTTGRGVLSAIGLSTCTTRRRSSSDS